MLKKLSVRDKAPDIRTTNVLGVPVNVPSSQGRYTFVVFLRHAGCPWCHLTAQLLAKHKVGFSEKSCKIVCFVQSDKKTIEKSLALDPAELDTSFNIIADPKMEFYKLYGIEPKNRSLLSLVKTAPAYLKSIIVYRNKPSKIKGAKLNLVPGSFVVHNESGVIVYSDYDAQLYSDKAVQTLIDAIRVD